MSIVGPMTQFLPQNILHPKGLQKFWLVSRPWQVHGGTGSHGGRGPRWQVFFCLFVSRDFFWKTCVYSLAVTEKGKWNVLSSVKIDVIYVKLWPFVVVGSHSFLLSFLHDMALNSPLLSRNHAAVVEGCAVSVYEVSNCLSSFNSNLPLSERSAFWGRDWVF